MVCCPQSFSPSYQGLDYVPGESGLQLDPPPSTMYSTHQITRCCVQCRYKIGPHSFSHLPPDQHVLPPFPLLIPALGQHWPTPVYPHSSVLPSQANFFIWISALKHPQYTDSSPALYTAPVHSQQQRVNCSVRDTWEEVAKLMAAKIERKDVINRMINNIPQGEIQHSIGVCEAQKNAFKFGFILSNNLSKLFIFYPYTILYYTIITTL